MAKSTKELTSGTIWKQVVGFALPLLAASLVQLLYNFVNQVFAGQFIGTNASAADAANSAVLKSSTDGLIIYSIDGYEDIDEDFTCELGAYVSWFSESLAPGLDGPGYAAGLAFGFPPRPDSHWQTDEVVDFAIAYACERDGDGDMLDEEALQAVDFHYGVLVCYTVQ